MGKSIEKLNEEYFDGGLSPTVLKLLADLADQPQEVQEFVERMFRFMKIADFQATDFSSLLGWAIGSIIPRILPGAWGGMIPPITLKERHQKIDEYISLNPWSKVESEGTLLDLGCGFPPSTTVETALRLDKWQIIGADPSFAYYIVYDEIGDYASFDQQGELKYFQAGVPSVERWDDLLRDPDTTRTRFVGLLQNLLDNLPESDPEETTSVEKGENKLIKNPIRGYEGPNLSFLRGGIGELDIGKVDIVRCFNVLFYFDRAFRNKSLVWFADIINDGGLLICGSNWSKSVESRYTVYRKENDNLAEKEFAFSIDNLRPLGPLPWFALHDDDYETNLRAKVARVIRSDSEFQDDFDKSLDLLLSEFELCPRGEDGYLGGVDPGLPGEELEKRWAEIVERLDNDGYVEGAVSVLKGSGYDAWRNCVGHIGVDPKNINV